MNLPLKSAKKSAIPAELKRTSSLQALALHGADEGSHLWVVSYADLLMVLLCFFILFFATDEGKKDSIIQKILLTQNLSPVTAASTHEEIPFTQGRAVPVSEIVKQLPLSSARIERNGEKLNIYFPDNCYHPGKSDLNEQHRSELKSLLSSLKPYQNRIDLIFVGHSDIAPIKNLKAIGIKDNFDLSVTRAKHGLLLAEQMGFPIARLRVEGDGAYQRASRTLSLTIQIREEHP